MKNAVRKVFSTKVLLLTLVSLFLPFSAHAKIKGPHPDPSAFLEILNQRLGTSWVGASGSLLPTKECRLLTDLNSSPLGAKNPAITSDREQTMGVGFWQWLGQCVNEIVSARLQASNANLTLALGSDFILWMGTGSLASTSWSQVPANTRLALATHLSKQILGEEILNEAGQPASVLASNLLLPKVQSVATTGTKVIDAIQWMTFMVLSLDASVME